MTHSKPYSSWECYKAGMYKSTYKSDLTSSIEQCRELLSQREGLREAMSHVSQHWETSAAQHLTQSAATYRPWLGHAACCFEYGVPNWITKKAWNLLTPDQQMQANSVADAVRDEWMRQSNGQDLFATIRS